jgi:hypothetical protein
VSATVVLDNGLLRATVAPGLGGTILSLAHLPSGLSALGTVPWRADPEPPAAPPMTEAAWLRHYTGGWPILFPNGGEACVAGGATHGFHGEGSVSPWRAEAEPAAVTLTRRFASVPATLTRRIALAADTLSVTTEARAGAPCAAIWGEHATFGGDLLAGAFRFETAGAALRADPGYDPPANPLLPGGEGRWPHLPGKDGGTLDLSRPAEGWAALVYLSDFTRPEITLARDDGRLAATLSWQGEVFACLWYWIELAGTPDPPWGGRTRLIGLEPCSTAATDGLARAAARGDRLVRLEPGRAIGAEVRLRLQA